LATAPTVKRSAIDSRLAILVGTMGATIGAVAAGGAVGSVVRLLVGAAVQQRSGTTFPVGTLVVNLTGSLLIGFIIRTALETSAVSPTVRAMLTTGFCGGYTTFSAFSYETAVLIEDGSYARAALYILASVGLALAGTFAGFAAARWVITALRSR
jgi:fluoride exporter